MSQKDDIIFQYLAFRISNPSLVAFAPQYFFGMPLNGRSSEKSSRNVVDTAGRQAVVRNEHLPERELMTGGGPLPVKQLKVRDRSGQMRFTSKIMPPFLQRVPSLDALLPVLCLKGHLDGRFQRSPGVHSGRKERSGSFFMKTKCQPAFNQAENNAQ